MKSNLLFLIGVFISSSIATKAQFQKEVDVISYMDSRTFYSSSSGMEITYGYISMMNTYGIKLKNKNDVEFSFINCEITCYGKFADVYGMSPETGGNFGFRLFEDKLVIGYGEPNASTYYEK